MPMSPQADVRSARRIAQIAGALFIVAAVSAMVALLLYDPVLNDTDYVTSATDNGPVLMGAFLEVLLAFSVIGISVSLFPVIRRLNESLAIGYVAFRLLEAVLIVVGLISLLSAVTLNRAFAEDPALDAGTFEALGRALVAVHDWTFLLGPDAALGPSTLMLAYVLYRSHLVPRWIPSFGLVGGALIFASAMAVLFGLYNQISAWATVTALPVFAWEMSLAVWLIVRGFDETRLPAHLGERREQPLRSGSSLAVN